MFAVVCEDPNRQIQIGHVVSGVNQIVQLRSKSVALLPLDRELPIQGGAVYCQQFWGSGWQFDRAHGERGCPMLFNVTRECRYIYWAAKIRPIDSRQDMSLQLRIVHAPSNQRAVGVGIRQIDFVRSTPKLNASGSAVVYGKSEFVPGADAFVFIDFYAVATNCSVQWTALTQHREDYAIA